MSDKEKIRWQLSAYLDGELGKADRKKVDCALGEDEQLADELRRLRLVRQGLQELPRQHAGDQFVSQVLARAERQHLAVTTGQPDVSPPLRWVRWVASAAIVLIAVGVVAVVTIVLNMPSFTDEVANGNSPASSGQIARDVKSTDRGTRAESVASARGRGPRAASAEESTERALGKAGDKYKDDSRPSAGVPKVSDVLVASAPPAKADELEIPAAPMVTADALEVKKVKSELADIAKVAEAEKPPAQPAAETSQPLARGFRYSEDLTELAAVDPALAHASNELVFTDDLLATQRQVEEVLISNGLTPVAEAASVLTNVSRVRRQKMLSGANYVQLISARTTEVTYLAYVTPRQMRAVNDGLVRVRRLQRVSQLSGATADASGFAYRGKGPRGRAGFGASETGAPVTVGLPASAPADKPTQPKVWVAIEEGADGSLRLKEGVKVATPRVDAPSEAVRGAGETESIARSRDDEMSAAAEMDMMRSRGGRDVGRRRSSSSRGRAREAGLLPLMITLNLITEQEATDADLPTTAPVADEEHREGFRR